MPLMGTAQPKGKRPTFAQRIAARRKPLGWRLPEKAERIGSNCPDLALAKGPTRADDKRRKHDAEVEQLNWTRAQVWERSEGYCETCSDTERETATKSHKAAHELNKLIPRSQTRGLPPAERFNTEICLRQCPVCHALWHATLLDVRPLSEVDGMNGHYEVITHGGVAPVVTVVTRPQVFVPQPIEEWRRAS